MAHPVEEKHYIEWIEAITNDGKVYRQGQNVVDTGDTFYLLNSSGRYYRSNEHCR